MEKTLVEEALGDEVMTGINLVKEDFKQTSSKFRMVARIKPGEDVMEVLKKLDPSYYRVLQHHAESMLLRSDHRHSDLVEIKELSLIEFAAFKKAGGKVA